MNTSVGLSNLHSVTSDDGTVLPLTRVGRGPDLVIVHGGMDDTTSWLPVALALASHHRVWLLDRHEAGGSLAPVGSTANSVAEAVRTIGNLPAVLAHGSGAVAVLHALVADPELPISRSVLYEPHLPVGGPALGDLLPALADAIDRDDLEAGLRLYLRDVACFPPDLIDRQAPNPRLQSMLYALIAELRETDELCWTTADVAAITTPTVLLLGDHSAEHPHRDSALALVDALPHSQLLRIPHQGHFAHRFVSAEVAQIVRGCLTDSAVPAAA